MSAVDDAAAASAALAAAVAAPAKVSGDAGSVESHKLTDLIEADRYAAGKVAASKPNRGLRFSKLTFPGAV